MSGRASLRIAGMILGTVLFSIAVDNSWVDRVPESDRTRTNPYAGNMEAVAAGAKLLPLRIDRQGVSMQFDGEGS